MRGLIGNRVKCFLMKNNMLLFVGFFKKVVIYFLFFFEFLKLILKLKLFFLYK